MWLASSETLVTGNAKDIVLESCAINFLMQQSALLAVRLATTEQAVSSSVHAIVLMTSVISLGANVQVVCQEPREACVMRVSICLNESFYAYKTSFSSMLTSDCSGKGIHCVSMQSQYYNLLAPRLFYAICLNFCMSAYMWEGIEYSTLA